MLTAAIKQSVAVRLPAVQVPDLGGDGNEQEAGGGMNTEEASYDHVQDVGTALQSFGDPLDPG